jgi:ATP-dependent Lon protease
MLRADVVEACSNGQFHVYAVETIQEALEVLTGVPAGEPDEEGAYPEDSLLGKAVEQARQYWIKSIFRPDIKLEDGEETEEEEAADEEEAAAEPS